MAQQISEVWIVAENAKARARMAAGVREFQARVTFIVAGDEAGAALAAKQGADVVLRIEQENGEHDLASCCDTVAEAIAAHVPDLVLFERSANGFLLAGRIAARRKTCAITNVSAIRMSDGAVELDQMVFGGTAVRTVKPKAAPVLAVAPAHVFPDSVVASDAEVSSLPYGENDNGLERLSVHAKKTAPVDLASSKRIVCVGRGVTGEEDMEAIRALAEAIDAELACTRPVSEVLGLMETERYVGVTGVMFKPDLLVSIGISGQVQHMVGCNQSGTILAINKDKAARIFPQADLGLVADLKSAVPKLTALLEVEG